MQNGTMFTLTYGFNGVPENRGTGNSRPAKIDRNISDLTYILVHFLLGLVMLG